MIREYWGALTFLEWGVGDWNTLHCMTVTFSRWDCGSLFIFHLFIHSFIHLGGGGGGRGRGLEYLTCYD